MDWFAECNDDAAAGTKIIRIKGVNRDNQYSLSDSTITDFIAGLLCKGICISDSTTIRFILYP